MRYLIPTIIFVLISCTTWDEVIPPIGEFKLYTTITVQEDMCLMPDGEEVYGVTRYNTVVRSISTICVSLKSDDPEMTLKHEMDHAWRNALNLDPKARNQ
jgi:hypothetical protein